MKLPEYNPNERRSDRKEMQPVHEVDISDSLIGAVRRAYRDAPVNRDVNTDGTRRLNFHSGFRSAADGQVETAIGFIGQYNRFTPDEVAEALATLPDAKVALARENSPAVYIWTDDPHTAVIAMQQCGADELSVRAKARCYPNSEPEFSNSVWCKGDDTDLLRFIDTPALVRAWWD